VPPFEKILAALDVACMGELRKVNDFDEKGWVLVGVMDVADRLCVLPYISNAVAIVVGRWNPTKQI
jgi:hypothetical protein